MVSPDRAALVVRRGAAQAVHKVPKIKAYAVGFSASHRIRLCTPSGPLTTEKLQAALAELLVHVRAEMPECENTIPVKRIGMVLGVGYEVSHLAALQYRSADCRRLVGHGEQVRASRTQHTEAFSEGCVGVGYMLEDIARHN